MIYNALYWLILCLFLLFMHVLVYYGKPNYQIVVFTSTLLLYRLPLVHPASKTKKNEVNTISGRVSSSDARESRPDCVIDVGDFNKENGTSFFRPVDVCRTKCFLKAYAEYNETPNLDLTLFNMK